MRNRAAPRPENLELPNHIRWDWVDSAGEPCTRSTPDASRYSRLGLLWKAHALAAEYGLGGCRTFSEFVNMIDKEETWIIEGLLWCIHESRTDNPGAKVTGNPPPPQEQPRPRSFGSQGAKPRPQYVRGAPDHNMVNFLAQSGIPLEQIKKAQQQGPKRKITSAEAAEYEAFIATITPERLQDPNFNLREAYAKIRKYLDDHTVNINIDASTIFGK